MANPALDTTPLSAFEALIARLRRFEGRRVIPLHQGKTAFTTPVDLRPWGYGEFDELPYHDGPTCGTTSLLAALSEHLEAELGRPVPLGRLQVTGGITHALSVAFHCLLEPGDEVVICSPHWLFTAGLVRAAGGVPVEVPVFSRPRRPCAGSVSDRLVPHLTPRTRAIYFNTPNNPTGGRLSAAELQEIVRLAEARGLYLVADNAYANYDFTDEGFRDPLTLDGGDDLTFSAYSFSKSHGLTGYRIGYLVSPPAMAERARKFALYSIYSVPTCTQFAALSALRAPAEVMAGHRRFVRHARDLTVRLLHVPATTPEGGFYTLLDLTGWPGGAAAFVDRCLAEGVSLAPGGVFGRGYEDCVRLCYSVVGHDDLAEALAIVNRVYAEGAGP